MYKTRSTLMLLAGLSLAASLAAAPALAVVPGSRAEVNTDADGLALQGYDPVAYFIDGAATPGQAQFTAVYQGARYQFASEADLKKFQADPAAYTPQFGGFCATGAAYGEKVNGDPTAWRVVDDKLYLNYNKSVAAQWSQDTSGNIKRANGEWPTIKDNAATQ
ncbi:MAG TPA: YHS domain-containing (seleno)protein [Caulobacteraceae bacterium]|nr:YHS domain-containing (seleno)protein [Caulobacteraceae bacterium]